MPEPTLREALGKINTDDLRAIIRELKGASSDQTADTIMAFSATCPEMGMAFVAAKIAMAKGDEGTAWLRCGIAAALFSLCKMLEEGDGKEVDDAQ